ncbi:o-phosphoseryl-trna selenium transferase [Cystoisospora suis]|uniref:O-phosphoseryl-trna selenium transferase n=1 Tax=Cystoisospora suis TaxID=483139 RepID=A0A2C6KWP9_9APIC|nr:o-phosphoseryl-trna selenium transferase [Cystoisospora suis]
MTIGTRILEAPNNRISIAIDMAFLENPCNTKEEKEKEKTVKNGRESDSSDREITFLGSALFRRRSSGLRVVKCRSPAPPSSSSPTSSSSPLPPSSSSSSQQVRCGGDRREQQEGEERQEEEKGREEEAKRDDGQETLPGIEVNGRKREEETEEKKKEKKERDKKEEKKNKGGKNQKSICGHVFTNYGSHCESFPTSYATVAVALGSKREELVEFLRRFSQTVQHIQQKKKNKREEEEREVPPSHREQ